MAKIPVIKLGRGSGGRGGSKVKAKAETKTKLGAKSMAKLKKVSKPKPRLDQVPSLLAPPPMEDTRPTTKPAPASKPVPKVQVQVHPVPAKSRPPLTDTGDPTPVQGASCIWIGTLGQAVDDPVEGNPTCPHCGGRLLTAPDRATMELGFEAYEIGVYPSADIEHPARPHPGYTKFMHWLFDHYDRQCWPTIELAAIAYLEGTGARVDPGV